MARHRLTFLVAASSFAVLSFASAEALAAPPYIERGIVLPRHDWSFDVGLGIGHGETVETPGITRTGMGFNFEGAVGLTENLELGFRSGIRFGQDAQDVKNLSGFGPDEYGRLYDREGIFGTFGDTFANPEVRVRGRLVHEAAVELGLEGRAWLPFANHSYFGAAFGMPLAFRFSRVKLDTGFWVPVVFFPDNQTAFWFDVPFNVWIQASEKFWLGPMTGIRFQHQNRPAPFAGVDHTSALLGFGMGYQIASAVDFKAQFLFPEITDDRGARNFGVGAGFEFRIE